MKSTLERDGVEDIDAIVLSSNSPLVVELRAGWNVTGRDGSSDGVRARS